MRKLALATLLTLTSSAAFAEGEYDLTQEEFDTLVAVYELAKNGERTATPMGRVMMARDDKENENLVEITITGIPQENCEKIIVTDFGIEHNTHKETKSHIVPRTITHPEAPLVCDQEYNTILWVMTKNEVNAAW